ncbi:hypothetical protein BH10PSE4_BH10PSE4_45280 [soil metagenome]
MIGINKDTMKTLHPLALTAARPAVRDRKGMFHGKVRR